ncbi:DNA-processing protein DprA [Patescibacteria group bacterium]|nr:DNA-processing protein DprA [Patescibacteria group bacterium]
MVYSTPTELLPAAFPASLSPLREIPQPPKSLWVEGAVPADDLILLTVVGSRNYSTYGKQVIDYLISGLSGYPIGIVSGLALGVDGLAHEAALAAGLYTMAVPGSGLHNNVMYPARHRTLARKIVASGGGLLSEYPPDMGAAQWTFPQRNRIMAGLARATLLIEASEKSGTLITARMAVDYNRDLLVVPGNIFSNNSHGVHQFLKLGATPVTSPEDLLYALGFTPEERPTTLRLDLTPTEMKVLELLSEPRDRDELIRLLGLPTSEATTLLMMMEIAGHITCNIHMYRSLR